jgi:hypothetical protein
MTRARELAELAAGYDSGGGFGFRNRIINPAMVIDQRNAGASVTPNNTYTLDRWQLENSQTGKASIQQNAGSVTPPAGFTNYLGVTSLSAYSVGATDYFLLTQSIEGFNAADFAWGTANAQSATISFWVRSSLTGTFGGTVNNSAQQRAYPFTYTISAANTWEQKTVTIPGDTSGTWLTTNGIGIRLRFNLGTGATYSGTAGAWTGTSNVFAPTGATSVVGTNGATFYITGVQLEKGSTATSFDVRPYGTELQLCQRYFASLSGANVFSAGVGLATGAAVGTVQVNCPVSMRANPTIAYTGTIYLTDANSYDSTVNSIASQIGAINSVRVSFNTSGGMTTYRPALLSIATGATLTLSVEL